MRPKTKVYDTYWPWRLGVILKASERWTKVRWSDGEEWNYDRSHRLLFLREYFRGRPRERAR